MSRNTDLEGPLWRNLLGEYAGLLAGFWGIRWSEGGLPPIIIPVFKGYIDL